MVTDVVAGNLDKLRTMIAYDGTVDRDVLVLQTKTLIATSSEMLFEAGKRLCVLKEMLPHGEFQKTLAEIGIEYTAATRMMNATIKLGPKAKVATSQLLSKSKIFELTLLDDDYLKELDENGTIAGVELDEYDRMTTRELRAAVRILNTEKKAKEESYERLLSNEQETRQKLLDENEKLKSAGQEYLWSEQAKQILSEIPPLKIQLIQSLVLLQNLIKRAKELSLDYPAPRRSIYKEFEAISDEMTTYYNDYHANLEGLQPLPDNFELNDLNNIEIDPDTQKAIDDFERRHENKNAQDADFEDMGGGQS